MTPWLPYQQRRLAIERSKLRTDMSIFSFREERQETHIVGHWSSLNGYWYAIRIYLTPGYPEECPSTYVVTPNPLLDHHGEPVLSWGLSHAGHTWKSDRDGWPKLCTYRPEYWDPRNTLVQVAKKSLLWIIAYEEHVLTGKDIADLLATMRDKSW